MYSMDIRKADLILEHFNMESEMGRMSDPFAVDDAPCGSYKAPHMFCKGVHAITDFGIGRHVPGLRLAVDPRDPVLFTF